MQVPHKLGLKLDDLLCILCFQYEIYKYIHHLTFTTPGDIIIREFNPFAPGDFAEKRILKLVEWFSGHCRAIKS